MRPQHAIREPSRSKSNDHSSESCKQLKTTLLTRSNLIHDSLHALTNYAFYSASLVASRSQQLSSITLTYPFPLAHLPTLLLPIPRRFTRWQSCNRPFFTHPYTPLISLPDPFLCSFVPFAFLTFLTIIIAFSTYNRHHLVKNNSPRGKNKKTHKTRTLPLPQNLPLPHPSYPRSPKKSSSSIPPTLNKTFRTSKFRQNINT